MSRNLQSARHVAVIGAGYWGKNIVRALDELGALAVICDSDKNICKERRKAHPHCVVVQSAQDALRDPHIRAVAIATPAATHSRVAREALEAGKDVFVEKPLALKAREGEALVRLAKKKNKILMVGHILHYHPAVLAIKRLIKKKALGTIFHVYSHRLNLGKFRKEENVLWSFAPHDTSLIIEFLGMPRMVGASGKSFLHKNIPDTTISTFEFDGPATAHIFVSWLNPFKEQTLTIVGSRAMAVFKDGSESPLMLWRHRLRRKNGEITALRAEPEVIPVGPGEPLKEELKHFLECVATRRRPHTDGEEGLRVLRVLEACQKSLDNKGKTQKV